MSRSREVATRHDSGIAMRPQTSAGTEKAIAGHDDWARLERLVRAASVASVAVSQRTGDERAVRFAQKLSELAEIAGVFSHDSDG